MKYNTISYERTRKRNDDVTTAKVELTIEEGDDPHNVMELAQSFIDSQLGFKADAVEERLQTLKRQCRDIEAEKRNLESSLDYAKARWEKVKEFLTKHSVPLDDDVPF